MKLSIVVPFRDEAENVEPVLRELRGLHPDAQLIAVDDGSRDGSLAAMRRVEGVEVLQLGARRGQSAALHAGLRAARGEVCVLMDGDGQSDPAEIKNLLQHFPAWDFVNGCRTARRDTISRRWLSRGANALRRVVTRDGMSDTGGTPKAMKRECVELLVPFDGMHRFLPALMRNAGYRVLEVPVAHRARLSGESKYSGLGRALRGAWDLVGVRWLLSRQLDRAARARTEHSPHRREPGAPPR